MNTLLTIAMITNESVMMLVNNLTFTNQVDRTYDDRFGVAGAKIGEVLNIRKPVRWSNTQGQGIVLQDVTETSVPLVLDTQYQRAFQFTSADLTLSIDDFAQRYLRTAIASMANQIDFNGLSLYKTVANAVGTPGTPPTTLLTYLDAGVKLDNEAAPVDGQRSLVLNPRMQANIVDSLKGLFQASDEISKQYKKGKMGTSIGFEWYMDQNVNVHTVGPLGGTPAVTVANQTGSSLLTSGWTAAAALRLNRGDVFTIAGVNGVNPQNHQSTGELRQFVATAPVSSDGAGLATIPIFPALILTGPYQTVDALPGAGALITVLGAAGTQSPQGLAFHKEAFTFACADLVMPGGVDMGARKSDKQLGLSMRIVRAYDINTDRYPCRIDLLGGWAPIYPEIACRIEG